jgi:hypothetical protein
MALTVIPRDRVKFQPHSADCRWLFNLADFADPEANHGGHFTSTIHSSEGSGGDDQYSLLGSGILTCSDYWFLRLGNNTDDASRITIDGATL